MIVRDPSSNNDIHGKVTVRSSILANRPKVVCTKCSGIEYI